MLLAPKWLIPIVLPLQQKVQILPTLGPGGMWKSPSDETKPVGSGWPGYTGVVALAKTDVCGPCLPAACPCP